MTHLQLLADAREAIQKVAEDKSEDPEVIRESLQQLQDTIDDCFEDLEDE